MFFVCFYGVYLCLVNFANNNVTVVCSSKSSLLFFFFFLKVLKSFNIFRPRLTLVWLKAIHFLSRKKYFQFQGLQWHLSPVSRCQTETFSLSFHAWDAAESNKSLTLNKQRQYTGICIVSLYQSTCPSGAHRTAAAAGCCSCCTGTLITSASLPLPDKVQ